MDYYHLAKYVILIQVFLLLFLLTATFFAFFYRKYRTQQIEQGRYRISKIIINFFLHKKELDQVNLLEITTPRNLLAVIEKFDRYFRGDEWENIKQPIIEKYLISLARDYALSTDWTSRNFAARVFALFPYKEDRQRMLQLLDDPAFLVSGIASIALIRLEEKEATLKVIEKMPGQHGYAYYFYHDLFIDTPKKIVDWVAEIEKETGEEEIKHVCKEIQANLNLVNQ